jgi:hypothetical protein
VALVWIDIGLVVLAAGVFLQDLKERAVSVLLFIALFVLACSKYFLLNIGYKALILNSAFILFQVLVILLYCKLKHKEINIFKFIGPGDLLCWGVLVWLFTPLNFLVFFVISLITSFMLFELLKAFQQNLLLKSVPLAGFQCLMLILVLGLGQMFPLWQPYDDFSLLRIINLV